ncbi:TIGR03960 family B12-binding radical SAM protein [Thermosulfurimonas sp. F29]|uniref:TIGR03960 family B12-binding radical SAM protein n=1 Tax=Thermosulfurimonas sp. F29 TaxID=2867247 RepID=UPI001C8324CF|nr:TIGR03960 family B12-binding radical SAM protein [Thermosulfurimonas sp. F29]MBX6422129.1 TIGR03960 family B12-binding radical SAM protein [Thermosulfurimonas sp. F29]
MYPAELLPRVRKPARYLDGEVNAFRKPWEEAEVRFCLVYPDLYEIGMSHIGLLILYLILNSREGFLADRAYVPARDLERLLRERGLTLLSWEHSRPLRDFDVVGISYPYELCATNIVTVLELSGIPILAGERGEGDPLVLGGGSAMANPEPVADFYDAIVFGDGEEAIVEVAEVVREWKAARGTRRELLEALTRLPGLYVPAYFRPVYDEGRLAAVEPLKPGYERVRRRVVADLDAVVYPFRPPVPWFAAHDRLSVEISRGCTRGCRFCQASSIYRPVRERSPERVLALAEEGLSATGYEELSLLSLSAGDYTALESLVRALYRRFGEKRVSLSLPSLRVGSLTPGLLEVLSRGRRTGLTLAPEAGTERLRRVINKDISEEELLRGAELARELGWRDLKLYFMIGLPTETEEDLEAIPALARRVRKAGRGLEVTVSVSTFVPKPHTPFQWERQIDLEATRERLRFLKRRTRGRGLRLKWHLPEQSFLEGVLSRGDRRLSTLILEAHRLGARLDGWSEEFRLERWLAAARNLGLDLSAYLRERDPAEVLPWEHLESGLAREFLLAERERALRGEVSPDCRFEKCLRCGVCGKEIRNRLFSPVEDREPLPDLPASESLFWYRVIYAREGTASFLSQIEVQRVLERALRRAGVPLAFTRGFNPRPKLSFGRALPVGVASQREVFFVALSAEIPAEVFRNAFSRQLPEGFSVREVSRVPEPEREPGEALFEAVLPGGVSPEGVERRLRTPLTVKRSGGSRTLNLEEWIGEWRVEGDRLRFTLRLASGGPRPEEVAAHLLGESPEEILARGLKKLA